MGKVGKVGKVDKVGKPITYHLSPIIYKLFPIHIRLLTTPAELHTYDQWVKSHPDGTLWQSVEWKEYQERLGREVRVYIATGHRPQATSSSSSSKAACPERSRREAGSFIASAMVIIDKTAFGLSTWDIPRGPLLRSKVKVESSKKIIEELIEHIQEDAKKDNCLSIYLSPTLHLCTFAPLQPSPRHEQPEATRIIDLTLSEEEILKQMHQKGRYNIKVAEKKGVVVEESEDIQAYAKLAQATAARDGFSGASKKQYEEFLKIPGSFMLLAHKEAAGYELRATSHSLSNYPKLEARSPIAGLIGILWNGRAYYYYGASNYEYRNLMAPYALQWAAMKKCKTAGCTTYDLLGITPLQGEGIREKGSGQHPWSGISSFKEKFGGEVVEYPAERELVLKPIMQAVLRIKRRIMN